MFKVNNKDTRICKVNDKVKNEDTVDAVLPSLVLTLNKFHFLLKCLHCCSDALCLLESIYEKFLLMEKLGK